MQMADTPYQFPDASGHFGPYGGIFVAETLIGPLQELSAAYDAARVDPASASRINCGIGHFTLTDGVLTDRGILLDTTRVRVRGTGRVDFRDESIAMRLQPQPKQAQFFSLATPIEVSGSVTDPKIGVNAGDVLATAGVVLVLSAFFLKAAVVPFHTWAPDGHSSAPR